MQTTKRRKVYAESDSAGVRVPFIEVALSDSPAPSRSVGDDSNEPNGSNEPVLLYDTSGPGSDPEEGLPALRLPWILGRGDVEEYEGRRSGLRDDGRAALRRGTSAEPFPGAMRKPLRASDAAAVTQLAYARR
ncbi:MAG TPA: hypothetical protein VEJ87_11750, partial [Acidimicrobiales bacterium]|nr:hypothetical protein [Acidimicrobiales bacterium]